MEASNPNSQIQNNLYPRDRVSSPAKSSVVSTNELLGMTNFTNDDLGKAIGLIANQLGVSPMVARRLLYQMAGQGLARNMQELRQFMQQNLALQDVQQDIAEAARSQQAKPQQKNSAQLQKQTAQRQTFNPAQFTQQAIRSNNLARDQFNPSQNLNAATEPKLSQLVQSPRAFASWLVNNKAAFVLMRAKPQLAYLLMAAANPQIKMSPIMLAEIAKLMTQVIKLKQGKSEIESVEENEMTERGREVLQDAMDHEHTVVSTIKDAIDVIPFTPLRDFLMEAERFAEEEVANMWSLALKKEKEIEREILEKLKQFKKDE